MNSREKKKQQEGGMHAMYVESVYTVNVCVWAGASQERRQQVVCGYVQQTRERGRKAQGAMTKSTT